MVHFQNPDAKGVLRRLVASATEKLEQELSQWKGAATDYATGIKRELEQKLSGEPRAGLAATGEGQKALEEVLTMALDEVWFTFRPKGYGAHLCAMCKCNIAEGEEHSGTCYYGRLNEIARKFCPALVEGDDASGSPLNTPPPPVEQARQEKPYPPKDMTRCLTGDECWIDQSGKHHHIPPPAQPQPVEAESLRIAVTHAIAGLRSGGVAHEIARLEAALASAPSPSVTPEEKR